MTADDLTHVDSDGKVHMVGVSGKAPTDRLAIAEARVVLPDTVLPYFHGNDLHLHKGAVFQTARIAGIMAAKRTGELIPLCHPLNLDLVELDLYLDGNEVVIRSHVQVQARTGVEMEALTAASVAALTIYDMCKALSHDIILREIKLIQKSGGKRDFKRSS